MISDIADIKKIKFGNIPIQENDKIAYCCKIGWKFGLYFNFNPSRKLKINEVEKELATLHKRLRFEHVYKTLGNANIFDELQKDGWFPFIEIIDQPYESLVKMYQNKFEFEEKIKKFVDSFNKKRIEEVAEKWWSHESFQDGKKSLIQAGLNAYYKNDKDGFIACIKILTSEIEGIIRLHYFDKTQKARPNFKDLIKYIVDKGREKGGEDSLFLPSHFLKYLEEVFFADFDLQSGKIELSRHSLLHGVAKGEDYRKIKALQTILVLDQLYFYLS